MRKCEVFGDVAAAWWHNRIWVSCVTGSTVFLYWCGCISAVYFNDSQAAVEILLAADPKVQKSLARNVRNFDEAEWSKVSVDVVKRGSIEKVISRGISVI